MDLRGSKAVRFPLACNRPSPEEVVDFHPAREVTARFKAVVASGLQPQCPGVGSGNEIGVAVAVVITDSHDTVVLGRTSRQAVSVSRECRQRDQEAGPGPCAPHDQVANLVGSSRTRRQSLGRHQMAWAGPVSAMS